jgi:hypothetical protein
MGRNEYSRHRGCSTNAVRKAEASGRIAAAVVRDDGRFVGIKWRLADQLWDANTDLDQATRSLSAQGAPSTPARAPVMAQPALAQLGATQLARAIALANVDFLESASRDGYLGPIELRDLVELGETFIHEFAQRVEAAIGPDHAEAILAVWRSFPEEHAGTIQEAIGRARAVVPR